MAFTRIKSTHDWHIITNDLFLLLYAEKYLFVRLFPLRSIKCHHFFLTSFYSIGSVSTNDFLGMGRYISSKGQGFLCLKLLPFPS